VRIVDTSQQANVAHAGAGAVHFLQKNCHEIASVFAQRTRRKIFKRF